MIICLQLFFFFQEITSNILSFFFSFLFIKLVLNSKFSSFPTVLKTMLFGLHVLINILYILVFCVCFFRSTGYSEVIVVVGGCERVGGFNLPYTECYDPVTGEWKSLAKLPEFTKSEYAVCALRNDILVSGE